MEQGILIVGVNHRTAPVGVRERLAFADQEVTAALQRLKARAPSVFEAAILSTCNRVEVVITTADPARAAAEVGEFLASDRKLDAASFDGSLYRMEGREAVRHLFRVGASLDSMVIGEPQILGQLKIAYTQATAAGSIGIVLHRAFHRAFSVAKRVREATLIGHGSVSVSSAAIALARQIFDRLDDKTVMLMGAGRMAELTARHLKALGIESLLITNRTFDRAVALARELGGTAVPYDSYHPYLKLADVVIGSVAAIRPVLGPGDLEPIVRERRYRPMFLIDLGVPRNFDERLNAVANVYLYDIDDLGAAVMESHKEREREAEKAEQIVELELESFLRWLSGLELVPAIKDIRTSIERLREAELGRHRRWLETIEPAERERVELMTRALVNKILHRVLAELRRGNGGVDRAYATEIARRLLCGEGGLPDDDDDFDEEGT
ncbi:MAG: glutamyl-tRNA reductase [Candidatus Binataceae bacterium]